MLTFGGMVMGGGSGDLAADSDDLGGKLAAESVDDWKYVLVSNLTEEDFEFLESWYADSYDSWIARYQDQPFYCLRRWNCHVAHPCLPCVNVIHTFVRWRSEVAPQKAFISEVELEHLLSESIIAKHREKRIR